MNVFKEDEYLEVDNDCNIKEKRSINEDDFNILYDKRLHLYCIFWIINTIIVILILSLEDHSTLQVSTDVNVYMNEMRPNDTMFNVYTLFVNESKVYVFDVRKENQFGIVYVNNGSCLFNKHIYIAYRRYLLQHATYDTWYSNWCKYGFNVYENEEDYFQNALYALTNMDLVYNLRDIATHYLQSHIFFAKIILNDNTYKVTEFEFI